MLDCVPRARVASVLGVTAGLLVASAAHAGGSDCGCDHEIQPGTTAVNGTDLGIVPGDVVCVMAGDYEFIRFSEIRGDVGNRVTIKNCGGVVNVRNEDRAYAVDFQGSSQHFHLTGSGEPGLLYGFRVSAPDRDPWPGVGLWFLDKSSDYEVDHIEVYETGFAGVMSKTDPLCDGSADQDVFVQRNVHFHHLWVHDTGGEGFYIGSTQSDGHTISCDGNMVVRQPHFLEGIEVDHVLIEDTEWDGIQIGMAHQGCSLRDSIVRRVGSAGVQYQQQGVQIGTYSSCDVRRNVLSDGPQMGIIVLGAYDTTLADNVIVRFAEDAIYANLNATAGPVVYRVAHNTLADYGGAAVRVFGDGLDGSVAWNNFVIGDGTAIGAGNDVMFGVEGNVFSATVAEAGFVDAALDDYRLTDTSPARGAGIDHVADGFDVDLEGKLRAVPPAAGAFEHDEDSPTTVSTGVGGAGGGGDGGASASGGAGQGAGNGSGGSAASDGDSDGGGCDCRAAQSRGGARVGPAVLLLAVGWWLRKRRSATSEAPVRARR